MEERFPAFRLLWPTGAIPLCATLTGLVTQPGKNPSQVPVTFPFPPT